MPEEEVSFRFVSSNFFSSFLLTNGCSVALLLPTTTKGKRCLDLWLLEILFFPAATGNTTAAIMHAFPASLSLSSRRRFSSLRDDTKRGGVRRGKVMEKVCHSLPRQRGTSQKRRDVSSIFFFWGGGLTRSSTVQRPQRRDGTALTHAYDNTRNLFSSELDRECLARTKLCFPFQTFSAAARVFPFPDFFKGGARPHSPFTRGGECTRCLIQSSSFYELAEVGNISSFRFGEASTRFGPKLIPGAALNPSAPPA